MASFYRTLIKALIWEGFCRRILRPMEEGGMYFAAFFKMGMEEDPGLVIGATAFTLLFVAALLGISYIWFTLIL